MTPADHPAVDHRVADQPVADQPASDQPAALTLVVDTGSPVPPYEQLRQQVTGLVQGRALAPGTRLPSVRQLAGDLGLAAGTVARAYRELEAAGVVTSGRRSGTRVATGAAILGDGARRARLAHAAGAYAMAAGWLGATDQDAMHAVRQALDEVRAGSPPAPAR